MFMERSCAAVSFARLDVPGCQGTAQGAPRGRIPDRNIAERRSTERRRRRDWKAQAASMHERIIAEAQSEANKLKLREQTATAEAKGIFGAPTFFVGEEMFWGNDRLDDALLRCKESS